MKILHYTKYYPPYYGGIEKVTYDLVEEISRMEMAEVEVLCYKKDDIEDKNDNSLLYKIKRNKALLVLFKMPISIVGFFSLLKRRKRNDIIHVHLPNPLAMIYILITSFFCKNKIVAHWHSDIVNQKKLSKIVYGLEVVFLSHVDKIIATSEGYAASSNVLKKFGDKVINIPIGLNTCDLLIDECFLESIKHKYKDKKIIFSLGRLTYYKGFEYLIEAAKALDDNYLIIIGGCGEELGKLEGIIKKHKLEEKVTLLGRINDNEIGAYYKVSTLFCLPSVARSEAFGVVQLEAMSFGKPVISTNIIGSGVPWVNKHGVSGIVVEPKSALELSDAIKKICTDKFLYEKLSNGALERFNNNFTSCIMNEKVIKMYKEL